VVRSTAGATASPMNAFRLSLFVYLFIYYVYKRHDRRVMCMAARLRNGTRNAISAWYGFLNKSYVLQINSLFKRAFKYG